MEKKQIDVGLITSIRKYIGTCACQSFQSAAFFSISKQECGSVIVAHVVQGNSNAINQHPCGKQIEQCFPWWWNQLVRFLIDNRSPHSFP